MDWQVVFAARSTQDLQKIIEHIARDNPAAAEQFGLLLIEQAELLAKTPEMGPVLPQRTSTRFFPIGSYLIIYRLDVKKRIVRVLRFWHSARATRPTR